MSVLSAEQVEQFHDRGFVRLERGFEESLAAEQRDSVWRELRDDYGVLEADRATWNQPSKQLRRTRDAPALRAIATDRVRRGLDCLLGSWEALGPEHWGSVLFTFPNADKWDVPRKTWHWDNPITPHLQGCAALQMFSLLAPMRPGGGATVIVEGMHRVLIDYFNRLTPDEQKVKQSKQRKRAMKTDAWLRRLQDDEPHVGKRVHFFMEKGGSIGGVDVKVWELTGEAGDVYFIHPLVAHMWAPNALATPRMMRSKLILKRGFDRRHLAGHAD